MCKNIQKIAILGNILTGKPFKTSFLMVFHVYPRFISQNDLKFPEISGFLKIMDQNVQISAKKESQS